MCRERALTELQVGSNQNHASLPMQDHHTAEMHCEIAYIHSKGFIPVYLLRIKAMSSCDNPFFGKDSSSTDMLIWNLYADLPRPWVWYCFFTSNYPTEDEPGLIWRHSTNIIWNRKDPILFAIIFQEAGCKTDWQAVKMTVYCSKWLKKMKETSKKVFYYSKAKT